MRSDVQVIWDLPDEEGGNTAHITEHGLTPEEVEDVLLDPTIPASRSKSSGERIKYGWTSTGVYIMVTWKVEWDDPEIIVPVTAYEVPVPAEPS